MNILLVPSCLRPGIVGGRVRDALHFQFRLLSPLPLERGGTMYHGELSEFDILGAAPAQEATQSNIAKTLETASAPKIKRGDRLLLIQSGAMVPDNEMMDAARDLLFTGAVFRNSATADKPGRAESLRLRAAQGGYRLILCYWGILESAQEDREGKAVS